MLTEQQIQALLAAETEQEFRALAAQYGVEVSPSEVYWPNYSEHFDAETFGEIRAHFMAIQGNQPEVGDPVAEHDARVREQAPARAAAAEEQRVAEAQGRIQEAQQTGAQVDPNDVAASQGFSSADELWLAELLGNRQPTDQEKEAFLFAIESETGTSFNTWEEMVQSGFLSQGYQAPDGSLTTAGSLANEVLLDLEPAPAHIVHLDRERTFAVEDSNFQAAARAWNLTPTALTRIVRLADRTGLRFGRNGETVYWQPLVMMMRMYGVFDDWLKSSSPTHTELEVRNGQVVEPHMVDGPNTPDSVRVQRSTAGEVQSPREEAEMRRQIGRGTYEGLGNQMLNTRQLSAEFAEGMRNYGDVGLALLYAYDASLAGQVSAALRQGGPAAITANPGLQAAVNDALGRAVGGGDPGQIREVLLGTGYSRAASATGSRDLFGQYLDRLDAEKAQAESSGGSGPSGPSEPVVQLYDPAQLDETYRQLYEQMFFAQPTDQQLAQFRSSINSAVTQEQSAKPGDTVTSVDPGSRALEEMRQDPKYAELYGNKPDSVSEADYRNQFETAQRSILGGEIAGNVPLLAGMRSGRYQTAVGAAAATPEAWQNSTFMQRLYGAAQVVGRST